MGADQSKQLENTLFNLKFSAKSLVRESKKCEKAEKEEKTKLKKAIQKGNTEGARIYAENAIRNKNQVRLWFFFGEFKIHKNYYFCRLSTSYDYHHGWTQLPRGFKRQFQCSVLQKI